MISAFIAVNIAAADTYAATDPVTREEVSDTATAKLDSGMRKINNRMYKFSGGKGELYTGRVKNADGTRYYVNGSPWYGWLKLGTEWYYFRPDKSGVMAVGESVRTVTGTYKFDKYGRWTGSLTKSSKANKDFYVKYTAESVESYIFLDTKEKMITWAPSPDERLDYTILASINAKDKQIIYEMFMECGLNGMTSDFDYSGEGNIDLRVKLSGGEFSLNCGMDAYEHYRSDKDVQKLAYFTAFLENYIRSLPEYDVLNNYSSSALGSMKNVNETISDKNLRKFRSGSYGITPDNLITDRIFTSREDVEDFVKYRLLRRKNKKYKYIAMLLSYKEEYFKDHVLMYTETILPSNISYTKSNVTYNSFENLYSQTINVKKSSGKDRQYVFILESGKASGETSSPSGRIIIRK